MSSGGSANAHLSIGKHSTFCAWHSRPPQRGATQYRSQSPAENYATRHKPGVSAAGLQASIPVPLRRQEQGLHGLARHSKRWRVSCEGKGDGKPSSTEEHTSSDGSKKSSKTPGSRGPLRRLMKSLGGATIFGQKMYRVIGNVGLLLLLGHFLPIGGRRPLTGEPPNISIEVPFSVFVQAVRSNDVLAVAIDDRRFAYRIRPGSHKKLLPKGADTSNAQYVFRTVRPADYSTPYDTMLKHGVQFTAVERQQNLFITVAMYVVAVGMILGAMNRLPIKLPRRGPGRRHSSSGSSSQQTVSFADVAGVDEAKEELSEIVELLRSPERFTKLGARAPSGVLLVGPPGTGKTLLAKAVAGEADVPFFSISASEFVELYVGMGAMRVRELFASARKEAPAIVFIDEIDAVAKGRDSRLRSVGNDEREQTLNQLLTELDGFESEKDAGPVICIAATNRPDVLDSALLRPGRFDRRVSVERPDRMGREQILRVHIERRQLPLSNDVSVGMVASSTVGFTGADLANLVNEAALLAGRDSKGTVGAADFDHAILRAVAGIEKKRSILVGVEKQVVAKHEAGHALVSTAVQILIPTSAPVEKLSIIPRTGGALGFTYIPPNAEDRALMFDSELRGQMAMLMGGRAAEELTCGQISTGASDDIRRCSSLAYQTVSEYGLSSAVGPLSVNTLANGGSDEPPLIGRDSGLSKLAEDEAKKLVEAALAVAKDIVLANKQTHAGLSRELEDKERLEGQALRHWLSQVNPTSSLRHFVLQGIMPAMPTSRR
ncbi:g11652 [Coccomyxa viridis]|uniref:G11652 protein n=1 Tax=Coccomyxa viridis TaxID=1274662 RepID=A0ABP1GE37_9CHLO